MNGSEGKKSINFWTIRTWNSPENFERGSKITLFSRPLIWTISFWPSLPLIQSSVPLTASEILKSGAAGSSSWWCINQNWISNNPVNVHKVHTDTETVSIKQSIKQGYRHGALERADVFILSESSDCLQVTCFLLLLLFLTIQSNQGPSWQGVSSGWMSCCSMSPGDGTKMMERRVLLIQIVLFPWTWTLLEEGYWIWGRENFFVSRTELTFCSIFWTIYFKLFTLCSKCSNDVRTLFLTCGERDEEKWNKNVIIKNVFKCWWWWSI